MYLENGSRPFLKCRTGLSLVEILAIYKSISKKIGETYLPISDFKGGMKWWKVEAL